MSSSIKVFAPHSALCTLYSAKLQTANFKLQTARRKGRPAFPTCSLDRLHHQRSLHAGLIDCGFASFRYGFHHEINSRAPNDLQRSRHVSDHPSHFGWIDPSMTAITAENSKGLQKGPKVPGNVIPRDQDVS